MTGKVKWFDSKKGYGFIIGENDKEIFVHFTAILSEGFRTLSEHQTVEYEIQYVDRGQQAVNVRVIKENKAQVAAE